jgi:hypothetical protein
MAGWRPVRFPAYCSGVPLGSGVSDGSPVEVLVGVVGISVGMEVGATSAVQVGEGVKVVVGRAVEVRMPVGVSVIVIATTLISTKKV